MSCSKYVRMWTPSWRSDQCSHTLAGLAIRSLVEAHVTFTAVAPWQVQTMATFTQVAVLCTLISVCSSDHTQTVSKHTMFVLNSIRYWFLGLTWAEESISRESFLADTAIWALGVATVCVTVAHVCPVGALIQVWNTTTVQRQLHFCRKPLYQNAEVMIKLMTLHIFNTVNKTLRKD